MKHTISWVGRLWINFNIALFSGYAIFGAISLFWPHIIKNVFFILLHVATLIVNIVVVYGLVKRRLSINYLIAIISPLMIMHLIVFISVPLGIEFAFVGPSRAFYLLFFYTVSIIAGKDFMFPSFVAFNLVMVVINLINLCFFLRRRVADMFRPGPINTTNPQNI